MIALKAENRGAGLWERASSGPLGRGRWWRGPSACRRPGRLPGVGSDSCLPVPPEAQVPQVPSPRSRIAEVSATVWTLGLASTSR